MLRAYKLAVSLLDKARLLGKIRHRQTGLTHEHGAPDHQPSHPDYAGHHGDAQSKFGRGCDATNLQEQPRSARSGWPRQRIPTKYKRSQAPSPAAKSAAASGQAGAPAWRPLGRRSPPCFPIGMPMPSPVHGAANRLLVPSASTEHAFVSTAGAAISRQHRERIADKGIHKSSTPGGYKVGITGADIISRTSQPGRQEKIPGPSKL